MNECVLITGGAGFIGSHLADTLLRHGCRVRVFDNLAPQVHGPGAVRPKYLDREVELIEGDVRDPQALREALRGVDAVVHLAATVGVGQSMYEIARYTAVNNLGTAALLEALIERPVRRLVVASSMSIYGEGLYRDGAGRRIENGERQLDRLRRGEWELHDSDGQPLEPIPTPESKGPALASVYALSKFDQERMCLMVGASYGIPTVALRFFNVFGPRQALSNPYTGVLAIFAARLLNGNPPMIFEDGRQKRDFVSVHDVAEACRLALVVPGAAGHALNIGSGTAASVSEIAAKLASELGKPDLLPQITEKYRVGDIRHCFADIAMARRVLGYEPKVRLEDGILDLVDWLVGQIAADHASEARAALEMRGLVV
ncbi:MAG: NAD-dependent epimerase/dehydratase family protein [Alphaproteobacteria bacterium]|nr:NAD-dependent epimerase/dehydratase family protein [Alphaproteobacteria bacterium]